jgi:hypothetical protein
MSVEEIERVIAAGPAKKLPCSTDAVPLSERSGCL